MKKQTFGERLAEERNSRGVTQRDLAKKAGISQQRVHQLENPENDNVRLVTARKLAKGLGVPTSVLLANA